MADVIYNSFKANLMSGAVDLDTSTFYCMLVSSTYVPDQDTHTRRSHVTNEITGTGYTAGGAEITGKAVTQDDTNNLGKWDGNDVTWTGATITARGAVVYRSSGSGSASDELVAYFDFGSDKTATNGTFTVQWSTSGIVNLT